jgi:hypothetical protein
MTTASSEIQRRESLRVDAGRLMIAAGIIVAAVAIGVVLNRSATSETQSTKATASEQPISTAFLADTNPVRLNVMEKMNSIAPEVSSFVGNNTPTEVMNHMNELTSMNGLTSKGVSITLKVMRQMNEFSSPGAS